MDDSNVEDFNKAFDELMAFYEAPQLNHNIWWRALYKYPLEQVIAGFEAHIMDPEYGMSPPKPAHIIRHIERLYPRRGGCYRPYVPEPMPKARTPMIAPAYEALRSPASPFTDLYWQKYKEGSTRYGLRGPELVRWAKEQSARPLESKPLLLQGAYSVNSIETEIEEEVD
jgi:hypothetical protein